jgi:hypothetical protein
MNASALSDIKPDSDLTFIDGSASFSTQGVDFQISPTANWALVIRGNCRMTTMTTR